MTRTQMFLIFFSVVLTIYGLINTYIFLRGWQAIPAESPWRTAYAALFWMLALSFVAGRILEHVALSWFSDILVWTGSFWLAAMAYFLLILLCIDLLRLIDRFVPFFPGSLRSLSMTGRQLIAAGILVVVALAVTYGHLNARTPRVRTIEISIAKRSAVPSLKVVAVSDVHLGTLVCRRFFARIVEEINALDPDLVLFAGDVIDEDLEPVIRQDLGESLKRIKSRLGVYGITGNHEFIGGVEEAAAYLTEHGVRLLRDSAATVDDTIVLVGREDVSRRQFEGKERRPLEEFAGSIDHSLPIILMDHQPIDLQPAVDFGADLQISGHTHNGQLWPFNYIAEAVYEVSWGLKQKGSTSIYVSSGVGTWGPPVRTGNVPEIVVFNLQFQR